MDFVLFRIYAKEKKNSVKSESSLSQIYLLFKMQNKVIQRRLRALQYPYLTEFDINSIVKWLI